MLQYYSELVQAAKYQITTGNQHVCIWVRVIALFSSRRSCHGMRLSVLNTIALCWLFINCASALVTVSLKNWDICDRGYVKTAPKVCVLQKNVGDFLRLHPNVIAGESETTVSEAWFRVTRIFPGDRVMRSIIKDGTKFKTTNKKSWVAGRIRR